jgi:hypothetical protein
MWEPDPVWLAVTGGTGTSTVGVWRTERAGHALVVKRLGVPGPDDPPEFCEPHHFAYWRRQADVAISGTTAETPGLRGTPTDVAEDDEGITLTSEWVEDAALNGLYVAHAMGRFAGADIGRHRWLAVGQLRDRLRQVERRGGWPTLARTTAADVANRLWSRRETLLRELDALPQVPQHGDPAAQNLPGRRGDDVIAIDWGTLGLGPVGADLGLFLQNAREDAEPLLDAYLLGLPVGLATGEEVALGMRVSAAYTALSRAEWALARVAGGEGALAGKYRHPAVAPYLRRLQRQFPLIETLL